jgi:outer membrane immunogenic protein
VTMRGRIGAAFDRVLLYGTAGGAIANVEAGINPPGTFDSGLQFGWIVGAGVEVSFAQAWSAKVEYLYLKFGDGSCTITTGNCGPAFGVAGNTVSLSESMVRAGLNYRFSF